MGANKPSNKQRPASSYSVMAMNRQQEKVLSNSLEKQFLQALQTRKERGLGLGYQWDNNVKIHTSAVTVIEFCAWITKFFYYNFVNKKKMLSIFGVTLSSKFLQLPKCIHNLIEHDRYNLNMITIFELMKNNILFTCTHAYVISWE